MSDTEVTKTDKKPKKKRTLLQKIVNVFLYIGVVTLAIFIFLFGFSQTQTFRDWLRDFVVEQVNENLNGKISIEKIEGTIFTSLVLRNTTLTMDKDTLLNAGLIELRTSPLKIFLKKIYVRKAEIKDTRIAFINDSTGVLNISKLFPPSEEDTAKSHFPFRIEVADFRLTNVDFSLQNYDIIGSSELYSSMNMDDFRIDDIFLSLSTFADIDNNTFETKINYLALKTNIHNFNLKSLSGEFGVNPNEILVNDLTINTSNSDLNLNVKVNGLKIFESTISEDINYAVFNVALESKKFNFDDLSAFVPPTDMLKGAVGVELNASGNLLQLDVNKLVLDYEKTHLETRAIVRNINTIDEMSISAEFKNSYINEPDVSKLLPEYGIPSFEKLGVVKIDTLTFYGRPLNFRSNVLLSTATGNVSSVIKMDLEKFVTEYEISLKTKNFDLSPIASASSSLNLDGKFNGKGFSPQEMDTDIFLVANASTIEGIKFDSLSVTAQANASILDYSLLSSFNKAKAEINGSLNFLQENLTYKTSGFVQNLDVGKLISDTATVTDLNFNFRTEGENFDFDEMNMFLTFNLSPSIINGVEIDSLRTITDIFTDDNEDRVINFISDIADITVKGKFAFTDAISVISDESSLITDAFMSKIEEIMPSDELNEEVIASKKFEKIVLKKNPERYNNLSFLYLIDMKDFDIISPFLKNRRLEIDGNLSGNVLYDSDKIIINSKSNLNYVKYWGKKDVYFLSKLNSDIKLTNTLDVQSTKDIDLDLNARIDRIFTGTDLEDIYLDLNLKDDMAEINFNSSLENYASTKLKCMADLKSSVINLEIDTLNFNYKDFDLKNREKLNLSYSENRVEFNNCRLYHADGEILADGFLTSDQDQKLDLIVKNIPGKDLFKIFSNGNGLGLLDINLNLNGTVMGNYSNPTMEFELNGNDLTYKGKNFGDLVSKFSYANKSFSSDVKFFDSYSGSSLPALKLVGNIPINLSLTDTGRTLLEDEDIELNLISNNLDLTPFGEVIPGVSKFKGYLNCDLQVNGTIQEPYPDGYIKLDNSSFLLKYNNLEYDAGIKITVTKDYFSLDSLLLANSEGTQFGGKITGGGTAELDNLDMTSSQFTFNGNLKVLGEETKYVSPNLFGDLVISTNGNFELKFDRNGANLSAPINVDVANLTYSPARGAYTSSSENFIYKFVEDTVKKDSKTTDFEVLVNLSKLNEAEEIEKAYKPSKFDYSIDVTVEDEAALTYVLSREFNQDLIAIVRGNFQYESIGGKPIAQGELELLEGSTLEFIKTLNAEGKIRFESELSNPYLDITAIYKSYYYPEVSSSNGEGDQSGSDEIEVAVKMKIKGPLKELDKNLSQQSDKLTVYYGAKNIEDNIPDPTKDASDAVMFMLLGKFNDNVTQQERNVVSSYAASFAGSIVGGFLNRQLGDYVRSLEIRQSATDTKFILAGRAGKFRYSIGGSTAVFQDLGLANVKIEYPITRSFFMRLERKEALSEAKYINDMVNELGLKYRFEF